MWRCLGISRGLIARSIVTLFGVVRLSFTSAAIAGRCPHNHPLTSTQSLGRRSGSRCSRRWSLNGRWRTVRTRSRRQVVVLGRPLIMRIYRLGPSCLGRSRHNWRSFSDGNGWISVGSIGRGGRVLSTFQLVLLVFVAIYYRLLGFDLCTNNAICSRTGSNSTSTSTSAAASASTRLSSTNGLWVRRWHSFGSNSRSRSRHFGEMGWRYQRRQVAGRCGGNWTSRCTDIAATSRRRTAHGPISRPHPPTPPAGRHDPGGAGRRRRIARCHRCRRSEAGGGRCAMDTSGYSFGAGPCVRCASAATDTAGGG